MKTLHAFIPPFLMDFVHGNAPPFDGVYQDYADVHDENPWESDFWYQYSKTKLNIAISNKMRLTSNYTSQVLLLINVLSEKNNLRILDFSGGTGFIYHVLKPYFFKKENILWHVVDNEKLTQLGAEYSDNNQLSFSTFDFSKYPDISQSAMNFDLLFINNSVQYFPNYKEIFQPLLDKKIKRVFLTRLYAGEIPQYTTKQTIGRRTTPCTFLNFHDVCNFFDSKGYKIVFICNETSEDLSNAYTKKIPVKYRISYPINVIFQRID